jgi:proton glutamate symport protein
MLQRLRSVTLSQWILVSMVAGTLLGWADHELWPGTDLTPWLSPVSSIFLRMIKAIVVPLVFGSLVVGIAGHGDDLRRVGRLAFKSILYFEVATTLALVIGLAVVNLARPGAGVDLHAASAETGQQLAQTKLSLAGVLEHAVPTSFFDAAARNDVLQVVFFAVLFGIGLAQITGRKKEILLGFCDALTEVMFKFTGMVMKFAPFGIGAAIALTVGNSGIGVLKNLLALVGTLYGALVAFLLLVLVPVALVARVPVRRFWRWVREPWLLAFSTASSEAALPIAMENMEKFGVPQRIVAFVLPTGYTFNLDGSTLYLAVASLFVAQAAGVPLTLGQQVVMLLTLMLTSKGVAAVPRASLVILAGALASFGLPLEGVAVILGVDALMDMARTSINLLGNCLASCVMARWERDVIPGSELEGRA